VANGEDGRGRRRHSAASSGRTGRRGRVGRRGWWRSVAAAIRASERVRQTAASGTPITEAGISPRGWFSGEAEACRRSRTAVRSPAGPSASSSRTRLNRTVSRDPGSAPGRRVLEFRAESRSRVDARRMLGSRELHPTADQPRQLDEWLRAEHDSGGLDAVIAVPGVLEVNPRSDLIASRGGSPALLRRLEPRVGALRSRSLGRRDSWPTAVRRPTAPQWPASPVSSGPWSPICAGSASPQTLSAPAPPPPRSSMRALACTASSPRTVLFTAADRASSARRDRRCDRLARQLGGGRLDRCESPGRRRALPVGEDG
jgi:hypothetical protein